MKILMVCLGNICRSPIAEGVLQKKAKEAGLDWTIDSAGTNGYHVGEAPHLLSQKVCLSNGINISSQVSRQFEKEDFDRYDKIFAMAKDVMVDIKNIARNKFNPEKASLFLEALYPGENLDVKDPWYGNEDGYLEVFSQISQTCDAIITNYISSQK